MKKSSRIIKGFPSHPLVFSELSVSQIESDPNQPRKALASANSKDFNRLMASILTYGIEDPIKVTEVAKNRFLIIDGHRRFACAVELDLKTVPCRIYPKMEDGEMEARRYEMQNNRREWKTIEKANAIHKIRSEFKDATGKDVAKMLGLSQQNLFHYSQMRDMRMEYLELMSEHNLKEFQKVAFMTMLPRLRRVGKYQVDEIVKIIFEKVDRGLLLHRADFTSLGRLFLAATYHEEALVKFLSDPHLSIADINENYQLSGLTLQISKLTEELTARKNKGAKLTDNEKVIFDDLFSLMEMLR
ncbi:MAG: ParB/RepB/Spo0J family partition protein [Proteobacteria bacterium]|nr:MAG: ParB/RepB/Spo0J family partition protein [Pseudomonadota bacterium]